MTWLIWSFFLTLFSQQTHSGYLSMAIISTFAQTRSIYIQAKYTYNAFTLLIFLEHICLFNPFCPADQNKFYANSVDSDETAHNEPSHQDLHRLSFCFDFRLRPNLELMVLTRFKNSRNSGMQMLQLCVTLRSVILIVGARAER